VTIFGKDADNELAKLHGLDVEEEETEQIGPVECPRCHYQEKREAHFCSRCGQAMRAEAAADVREIEEDVKQDYADTEPGDDSQDKLDALDDLLEDPEVRSALLEKMGES
jgi:primosomal protein N'